MLHSSSVICDMCICAAACESVSVENRSCVRYVSADVFGSVHQTVRLFDLV